jgi:GDP/UDP-N,N'-diacetylbacillosamine 2-epimerase (hydrolysing)
MVNKKICIVTGSSSEYGPLKLLIKKIDISNKLSLQLLVTGMHLLKKYGETINEINKDGFKIAKVIPMYSENGFTERNLGKAIGNAISNFTDVFIDLKPDILVVTGDRFEPLASVIAASTLSIPIAHIHGGDSVPDGQIDEQIRHSITKFSHLHFAATKKHARRIKQLGEEDWRIRVVGAIAMDSIFQEKLLNKKEICEELSLDPLRKIIICSQHPYTYEANKAGEQMRITLDVLKKLELQSVILYPTIDSGSQLIINEIEKDSEIPFFKIFKRLERKNYLSLLKNADILIGNSSSGILETPIFKIPFINIGNRNRGRELSGNVIDVNSDFDSINTAIFTALSQEFKEKCNKVENPYGDGTASNQIVNILEELSIDQKLIRKKHIFED